MYFMCFVVACLILFAGCEIAMRKLESSDISKTTLKQDLLNAAMFTGFIGFLLGVGCLLK